MFYICSGSENDLRRALVKSKLAMSAAECAASASNLPRSDSMDSMLSMDSKDNMETMDSVEYMETIGHP